MNEYFSKGDEDLLNVQTQRGKANADEQTSLPHLCRDELMRKEGIELSTEAVNANIYKEKTCSITSVSRCCIAVTIAIIVMGTKGVLAV